LAEAKIYLSALKAPIDPTPDHEGPWQDRNSLLVRRVAVIRKAPLKIKTVIF